MPLVSIITPCYNYGRYLSETLDSLLSQTYQNWECIIVNDGSSDDTEDVALKYVAVDDRFVYVHQENKGLPGARNTALARAKGKYIQLLDADDLIERDKLLLQVELMENTGNIDLVYSSMMLFNSNAKIREFTPFVLSNNVQPSGKNESIITALVDDTFFLPGCVIFRRSLYEQVGSFNESLYGLEDWNYWSRAALLGKEFFGDKRVGTRLLCRDHDANMSKAYVKMLKSRIQARSHIIKVTKELRDSKRLTVGSQFIRNILKQHKLRLLNDEYQYHFHYGKKHLGLQAILKYSLYSGQPFLILKKAFSSLKTHENPAIVI